MKALPITLLTTTLLGVAVGLAGPANAALTPGTYRSDDLTSEWVFTSCGDGCLRREVVTTGRVDDFHRQGNTWTNVDEDGCTSSIDDASLVEETVCPPFPTLRLTLQKVS